MSLHGLLSVTIGVPNVEETATYYTDFGLAPEPGSCFSTVDGGPQLRIVATPTRRLVKLHVAADDTEDLGAGRGQPGCNGFPAGSFPARPSPRSSR